MIAPADCGHRRVPAGPDRSPGTAAALCQVVTGATIDPLSNHTQCVALATDLERCQKTCTKIIPSWVTAPPFRPPTLRRRPIADTQQSGTSTAVTRSDAVSAILENARHFPAFGSLQGPVSRAHFDRERADGIARTSPSVAHPPPPSTRSYRPASSAGAHAQVQRPEGGVHPRSRIDEAEPSRLPGCLRQADRGTAVAPPRDRSRRPLDSRETRVPERDGLPILVQSRSADRGDMIGDLGASPLASP